MSKGMLGMLPLSEVRGPRDTLEELLAGSDGPEVLEQLKRFNRKEPCWGKKDLEQAVGNIITVLSGLKLTERIARGKYGSVNSDINEKRFPHDVTTVGEWEFKLAHPNRSISSEDAKKESEAGGWSSAKAEHLFAFGEAFPEEQRKYPIVALGSVCEVRGSRRVLALWDDGGKRGLGLSWWCGGWRPFCRFLVVRKVQS
jgi:hypothetical protein